jgi:hypothetical protein
LTSKRAKLLKSWWYGKEKNTIAQSDSGRRCQGNEYAESGYVGPLIWQETSELGL